MKPLNLPTGSVRAILALLLLGTACTCTILTACKTQATPEGFYGMAGMVIAWYFTTRDKKES